MNQIELEQIVIKHILDNNNVIKELINRGTTSEYFDPINQRLYECSLSLYEQNETINEVTLAQETGKYSYYIKVISDIAELDTYGFSAAKTIQHLEKMWRNNVFIKDLSEITRKIDDGKDVIDLKESIEGSITRFQSIGYTNTLVNIKDSLLDVLNDSNKLYSGYVPENTIPLPNKIQGDPINPGNLVYLSALTGCGKSTFARQWAWDLANQGKQGIFFSLEMTQKEMIKGFAHYHSQVNPRGLYRCDEKSYNKWVTAVKEVGEVLENNLTLICGQKTRSELQTDFIRTLSNKQHIDFVIVDYLGLVSGEQQETEVERAINNSLLFRRLSLNYNIPFIVLLQFNRGANESNRPGLHQLKGSSQLEQDANIVYIISHKDAEASRQLPQVPVNFTVAKCRDGWTGDIQCNFNKSKARFEPNE